MEKTNLHYSTKNIPVASERNYKIQLLEKIEAVIKRMRWKATFFDSESDNEDEIVRETYGLKTKATPPPVKEMNAFEKDLIDMINTLKFRKIRNDFQTTLNNDIRSINECNKIYAQADKTTNMYKLSKDEHDKILTNAITSTYKKTDDNIKMDINRRGKKILQDSYIIKRMEINSENNCFFTLKDHKPNFNNNPTTRLINPAKNELGRLSKVILQNLNTKLRNNLKLNQWKNTKDVIHWFKNIKDKHSHKFMIPTKNNNKPNGLVQYVLVLLGSPPCLIPCFSQKNSVLYGNEYSFADFVTCLIHENGNPIVDRGEMSILRNTYIEKKHFATES